MKELQASTVDSLFQGLPADIFSQNLPFPRSSLVINGPVQSLSSLPPIRCFLLRILFQNFISNLENGVCIVLLVILLFLSFLGTDNVVCCSGLVWYSSRRLMRALVISSILLSVGSSLGPSPVALSIYMWMGSLPLRKSIKRMVWSQSVVILDVYLLHPKG